MVSLKSFRKGYRAMIFGASGAIGQGLCKHIQSDPNCAELITAGRRKGVLSQVRHLPISMDEPSTFADVIESAHQNAGLDLVMVATGVLHTPQYGPEKSWREINSAWMQDVYKINTILPSLIAQNALPILARTSKQFNCKTVYAALSARVGSISDNRLGGWYSYRASKAALNQIIRTLSIELSRKAPMSLCVGLHPGTVDSGLSKPFQRNVTKTALLHPDESSRHLLSVIDGLSTNHSGRIFDWKGEEVLP